MKKKNTILYVFGLNIKILNYSLLMNTVSNIALIND